MFNDLPKHTFVVPKAVEIFGRAIYTSQIVGKRWSLFV